MPSKPNWRHLKVGDSVAVYWEEYGGYFECELTQKGEVESRPYMFRGEYPTGEIEWHNMKEVKWRWADDAKHIMYLSDFDNEASDDDLYRGRRSGGSKKSKRSRSAGADGSDSDEENEDDTLEYDDAGDNLVEAPKNKQRKKKKPVAKKPKKTQTKKLPAGRSTNTAAKKKPPAKRSKKKEIHDDISVDDDYDGSEEEEEEEVVINEKTGRPKRKVAILNEKKSLKEPSLSSEESGDEFEDSDMDEDEEFAVKGEKDEGEDDDEEEEEYCKDEDDDEIVKKGKKQFKAVVTAEDSKIDQNNAADDKKAIAVVTKNEDEKLSIGEEETLDSKAVTSKYDEKESNKVVVSKETSSALSSNGTKQAKKESDQKTTDSPTKVDSIEVASVDGNTGRDALDTKTVASHDDAKKSSKIIAFEETSPVMPVEEKSDQKTTDSLKKPETNQNISVNHGAGSDATAKDQKQSSLQSNKVWEGKKSIKDWINVEDSNKAWINSRLKGTDIRKEVDNKERSCSDALLYTMVSFLATGSGTVPYKKVCKDLGYMQEPDNDINEAWEELQSKGFIKNVDENGYQLTQKGIDHAAPEVYKWHLSNKADCTEELHERIKFFAVNEVAIKAFELLSQKDNTSMTTEQLAEQLGTTSTNKKFFYGWKQHRDNGYVVKDPNKDDHWTLSQEKAFVPN